MKAWTAAVACCAVAVGIAGCTGSTLQSTLPNASTQSLSRGTAIRSWISPEASSTDLLYVSDDSGVVDVLTYPAGKLVGTLSGFGSPAGLCSDGNGNVFITDTPNGLVYEYAHGGKNPTATLIDFGGFPDGCAVDPSSGAIAITNFATSPNQSPGNVVVYTSVSGRKSSYTDANFNEFLYCSYDHSGNLFVDGVNKGTTSALFAELPKGGSSLNDLKVNQSIGYPGAVQWDGKDVAVEDLLKANVYRVKFSGSNGTVSGTVHLNVRSHLVVQFWIQGSTIIVPFGATPRFVKKVGLWSYPAGGSPTATFRIPSDVELVGAAVSVKP